VALIVREQEARMPGVSVEARPVREYPTGGVTAHTIGYLGPIPATLAEYYESLGFSTNRDKIGYAGVEAYFQDELAGRNGEKLVEIPLILDSSQTPVSSDKRSRQVLLFQRSRFILR